MQHFVEMSPETFCRVATSQTWLEAAASQWSLILMDHAHCERKAADSGLALLKAYVDYPALQAPISRCVREEMRHFELVLALMATRQITLIPLSPARYAKGLQGLEVGLQRQEKLAMRLLVAAIIEARSCERFAALVPYLDETMARFYRRLHEAEKRHFQLYLSLAMAHFDHGFLEARLEALLQRENDLITQPEAILRFHSGPPMV